MRWITLALIGLAMVCYLAVFGRNGTSAAAFFFPYTMTPVVIMGFLALFCHSSASQVVLLATTIGYAAWFVWTYVRAIIIEMDPQSPIALLFVASGAAPVLIPLGLLVFALEWRHARQQSNANKAGASASSLNPG